MWAGFHGTTSALSVLFYIHDTEHHHRVFNVYVHLSTRRAAPFTLDPTIKITFRMLPRPNHYGTFAANYPENVFLVP